MTNPCPGAQAIDFREVLMLSSTQAVLTMPRHTLVSYLLLV